MRGDDVYFLIGMDEHGQKVAQAAAAAGVSPQQFVDGIAGRFEAMWRRLSISYDQFMRTTGDDAQARRARADQAHPRRHARRLLREVVRGLVLRRLRAVQARRRDRGRQVRAAPDARRCSGRRAQLVLPAHALRSRSCGASSPNALDSSQPETRRNEILALLDQGLEDISITRSRLTWAIPFPLQLSTAKSRAPGSGSTRCRTTSPRPVSPRRGYARPMAGAAARHRQGHHAASHCVIWPAMLQAAELPLPERVWAHGFVLLGGERFSKIGRREARPRRGHRPLRRRRASATSCCAKSPFDTDGNFSWERFDERYTADLANALGNLASRAIAMVEKYCDGVVPSGSAMDLDRADAADLAEYHGALDGSRGFLLHEGLKRVMSCVSRGNEFVQSQQPWALAKKPESRARARTRIGRDHPTAGPPRDSPRAVHAEQGAGALDADRRPGASRGSALRRCGIA